MYDTSTLQLDYLLYISSILLLLICVSNRPIMFTSGWLQRSLTSSYFVRPFRPLKFQHTTLTIPLRDWFCSPNIPVLLCSHLLLSRLSRKLEWIIYYHSYRRVCVILNPLLPIATLNSFSFKSLLPAFIFLLSTWFLYPCPSSTF